LPEQLLTKSVAHTMGKASGAGVCVLSVVVLEVLLGVLLEVLLEEHIASRPGQWCC
jgi:hypothetical protein